MHVDNYWTIVTGKKQSTCNITLNNGDTMEGVYCGEGSNEQGLLMVIRPTGETKKQLRFIGTSYPKETDDLGSAFEIINIGISVSSIDAIKFND